MMNQENDVASGYGHEREIALAAAQAVAGIKQAYGDTFNAIREMNVSGTGRAVDYKDKVRKKNRKANKLAKKSRRK